jgi:aryl-alcohol dehydrogenase-like predicted oxidoreductase
MEYRRMGRTGLKVSELCLGTMLFGSTTDEAEANRILDMSLEAGINFIDTADAYANTESEKILGRALKERRQEVILATKFFNPMGSGPNDSGMSRVYIMRALEASLKRLQTDHVDIYYIHHVDVQTPLEEMLHALDDLVHEGKIRYLACSNYEAWRLATALGTSSANELNRFECYQPQYSLVVRDIELELIPLCQYHDLGVVIWSPLAGGFLAGKYNPGDLDAGVQSESGRNLPKDYFSVHADKILEVLLEVSKELGRSPDQVALRWALEQPAITSSIVGPRTVAQFKKNLGAVGWQLDESILQRLNAISNLPERYPQSFEKQMLSRRNDAVKRF